MNHISVLFEMYTFIRNGYNLLKQLYRGWRGIIPSFIVAYIAIFVTRISLSRSVISNIYLHLYRLSTKREEG